MAEPATLEDLLAVSPTFPCGCAVEYVDAIDKRGGRAIKMNFLRIGGSETAANRWISFFKSVKILIETRKAMAPQFI